MHLFIYERAPALELAVASSLADLASLITALADRSVMANMATIDRVLAGIDDLVVGDSEPLTLRFCIDGEGTPPDWVGAEGTAVEVWLGHPTATGSGVFASATVFTLTAGSFVGALALDSAALRAHLRGCADFLSMQVRVITPAGVRTHALFPVRVMPTVST